MAEPMDIMLGSSSIAEPAIVGLEPEPAAMASRPIPPILLGPLDATPPSSANIPSTVSLVWLKGWSEA